eukprot:5780200-Pyramimonas_sp.AAC.2
MLFARATRCYASRRSSPPSKSRANESSLAASGHMRPQAALTWRRRGPKHADPSRTLRRQKALLNLTKPS